MSGGLTGAHVAGETGEVGDENLRDTAINDSLRRSLNLSDLTNSATARASLALGNAATKNVGTTAGTVAAGDDSRLTGGGGGAVSSVAGRTGAVVLSNTDVSGLGTAATKAVGTTAGTVAAGNDSRFGSGGSSSTVFNVQDYGAVGDGGTSDSTGIQAAIAALQGASVTAGVTGGRLYFPPGEYLINATLNLHRFAGELIGCGVSNPPNYSASPGQGTVLRWTGSAGSPMFHLQDYEMVTFDGLRLEGKDSAIPSYLIDSYEGASDGAGTGAQLRVHRCALGTWPWSSIGTNVGKAAVAIGFTGTNGNNDQFHISDTLILGCPIGIDLPNAQSIWGDITDVVFGSCTTAGIYTNAGFEAHNLQFDDCAVDIKTYGAYGTPRINVHGWYSERALRIFDATTSLAELNVFGGHWTLGGGGAMTGNIFLNHTALTGGAQVNLNGVCIVNQLGSWPDISVTGAGGGITGLFRMVGCVHDGMAVGDLLLTNASGNTNGVNVVIDDAQLQTRQFLGSGVALNGGLVTSHLPT